MAGGGDGGRAGAGVSAGCELIKRLFGAYADGLQPDEVAAPTIHDTALVQLPLWVWRTGKARITGDRSDIPDDDELPEEEEALKAATAPNRNAEMRRRKTKIHPKKGTGLVG